MCEFFKRNFLGLHKFLPLPQSLLLLQPEVVETYFPGTGTLGWGPDMGLEFLTPKISLLNFYLLHIGYGPAHSLSVPLLPDWMDVISLIL